MVAQEKKRNVITLFTRVSENRRLEIDLPDDVPTGMVELTIRAATPAASENPTNHQTALETIRAKLLANGFLSIIHHAPEGTVELSPQELLEVGRLLSGARSSEDLINEDRGEY